MMLLLIGTLCTKGNAETYLHKLMDEIVRDFETPISIWKIHEVFHHSWNWIRSKTQKSRRSKNPSNKHWNWKYIYKDKYFFSALTTQKGKPNTIRGDSSFRGKFLLPPLNLQLCYYTVLYYTATTTTFLAVSLMAFSSFLFFLPFPLTSTTGLIYQPRWGKKCMAAWKGCRRKRGNVTVG